MKLSKNISSLFLFVSLVQAVAFKLTSRTYTDDTLSKQQKNNNQFKRLEEKPFSGTAMMLSFLLCVQTHLNS